LYRGDLIQGIYYPWAERLQAHFRKQFIDVMVQLSKACSDDGDYEAAVDALLKAIAVDRYAEHLYRSVMELYARLGRRNDVERVYEELEAALADELEAEPDPRTHALKNQLLARV
jgi:DNA-binding SARP family transcriptional activator